MFQQNGTEPVHIAFITADEIDKLLQEGGIVQGGKSRIFSFYQQDPVPDAKTAIAFLKEEYGTGGHLLLYQEHFIQMNGMMQEDFF